MSPRLCMQLHKALALAAGQFVSPCKWVPSTTCFVQYKTGEAARQYQSAAVLAGYYGSI